MPTGTEGYAKAEVTAGGIDTAALSSKTMEARKVPGLYAIGEAVDVTGWLGGYNFQWAWASGRPRAQPARAGTPVAEGTGTDRGAIVDLVTGVLWDSVLAWQTPAARSHRPPREC
jgi:hypothetical protein